ncbi:hypothetical protein HPB51_016551 [Rhipicephalus microplus]|uniref:Ubiquitin-conjugating enzyme E2 Z n=2 Tax=Rhipicephalus microplus TaxID=6941 RepID=A0A9J6EAP0_RHIMP|nr:hypothetical protein HPB51_016551 [Rhipicephalus microplus]
MLSWPTLRSGSHHTDEEVESAFSVTKPLLRQREDLILTVLMASRSASEFKSDEEKPLISLVRIKKEIVDSYKDPVPGLFVFPDENNMATIYSIVLGPADTPYEDAILIFELLLPKDYPINPPKVKFVSMDGRHTIHPFFFNNGTVSISILGTYAGPQWSSAQTFCSVLLSIQSILTAEPFFDHPFKKNANRQAHSEEAAEYHTYVRYEAIRMSVCKSVQSCLDDSTPYPHELRQKVFALYVEMFDKYVAWLQNHLDLNGTPIKNPFCGGLGSYEFDALISRLETLKAQVSKKIQPDDANTAP